MLTLCKANVGSAVLFIFSNGHTNILSHTFYLRWGNMQKTSLKLRGHSQAVVNNCYFDWIHLKLQLASLKKQTQKAWVEMS